MDTFLREKLQNYLFKEMDTRFKRIEDNVIKRMEEMISLSLRVSKIEETRACDREIKVAIERYVYIASYIL